jgi:DNA-binding HxlR family transcriptional regulator
MYRAMSERWAVLIMSEASFGTNRFGELHRKLGIAPNVLTKRLNSLVDARLLERRQDRRIHKFSRCKNRTRWTERTNATAEQHGRH